MTNWLDEREQATWRSWLAASHRLDAHLARRMQAEGEISMADFAVLVPLSEAEQGRLRAFEVGRTLQWEKSRVSHHLTRMEGRGLVERQDCGSDRRGAYVAITATGRAALAAAAPAHVEAVRAAVFDQLTAAEVEQLGALCGKVVAALEASDGCAEVDDAC
jgi:DNA-binding MarR family transcriptional regulator